MPTQCNAIDDLFAPVEGRSVVADFDGGAITSDAGALLLGSTDRAIGLIDRFAGCFRDRRRQELIGTLCAPSSASVSSGWRSATKTSSTTTICATIR